MKKNKPTNIGIVKLSLMVLLNFYAQKSVVFFVVNHAYLYGHNFQFQFQFLY